MGKLLLLYFVLFISGCTTIPLEAASEESADEFVARINDELTELNAEAGVIFWIRQTYINTDTAMLASRMSQKFAKWHSDTVAASRKFDGKPMTRDSERAIRLLRRGASQPAPDDSEKRRELSDISTDLEAMYAEGKWCPKDGKACIPGAELEELIAVTRDYDENLAMWAGWRQIGVPMRAKYQRFVELTKEGAQEIGYKDLGQLWRSNYDLTPVEFAAETQRLWSQVEPLYEALHCHVRAELSEYYGQDKVPLDKPIPAHLLGNMWAQNWSRLYDLLEPYPGVAAVDVTPRLQAEDWSPTDMVKSAESFYSSMGFDPLPETFWKRSQFSKPRDREVVCHASAWGLDQGRDLRIKMCIQQTHQELEVIYHELGHNFYQRAYNKQPPLFQDGAHDGFHEAIGDAVVLAMTPGYLMDVGMLEESEIGLQAVINDQMRRALAGVATLPWTKLVDEWRWGVFSGEISPGDYNKAWWELRERYQGVVAPIERTEAHFDPGAKAHVPSNTPYTRYFLANILQYQFYKALCDASGYEGPLHSCSFYGSETAGERFVSMMEFGQSQPWPETLETLTGTRKMDAGALTEYFSPLASWLENQNRDRSCGW